MLMGRPQTLTTGECLAGALPAGDSCNIFQWMEGEMRVARGRYVEDISHEIKVVLIFRFDYDLRVPNHYDIEESSLNP